MGMYFTGLYEAALHSHPAHLAMYAHFLVAGYLFFWLLIGVDRPPRPVPHPLRLPLLFASMVLHAFFGVIPMQSDQWPTHPSCAGPTSPPTPPSPVGMPRLRFDFA
jgi:cytochrome c oxidase assembly factor CtaG